MHSLVHYRAVPTSQPFSGLTILKIITLREEAYFSARSKTRVTVIEGWSIWGAVEQQMLIRRSRGLSGKEGKMSEVNRGCISPSTS